jgi:FMN reductase (NADPH)
MNETIQTMMDRASVRSFETRPLSAEHEDAILASALRAPTAGNMMLYTILRVKDSETRRALSVTCDNQPFIAEAPLSLVFLADFTRWSGLFSMAGIPSLAAERGIEWQGPTAGDFLLGCCDAMAAAENAVIAAQSLGVASCYIGDIMEQYEKHRELFHLPPQAFPIAMLCLGYPKNGKMPAPRSRFDSKYVIHDETYQSFGHGELVAMLGRELDSGIDASEYVRRFFLRKQGAEFAREMARSVRVGMDAFLNNRGGD